MHITSKPALKREIGAKSLALNAINLTIGAGIFVLPALVAQNLGPASFIAYILCGLLVVLIMLCFAETGSKITSAGGAYAYVEAAFGPFAGFLINTLFWFGYACLSSAAVINAIADMLALWFPLFNLSYIRIIFFVLVLGCLCLVNIRGVKEGMRLTITVTILKLTPLVLLVITGLFSINPANLAVKEWPGINSIGETALLLFFAFQGTESALSNSGEIKAPEKNIPRGIFLAVAGVLLMYMLVQLVSLGVLGNQLGKFKDAPLAALASTLIGPVGGTIILVTSVVSIFGMLSGDILGSPRILFAAANDKLLPAFLGRIHLKYSTPYWSIIVYGACCLLFASSGGFKQLAVLSSSAVLIIYLAVALATIRLRYKKANAGEGSFTIPGGLTVPILAVVTITWFLSHVTKSEIKGSAIFFAVLTGIYFAGKMIRNRKKQYSHEAENQPPAANG